MRCVPEAAEPLVAAFSVAFSRPTFQRLVVLTIGAILSLRRHTVTTLLRTVGPLARGHWSDYHRVFCRARWSCRPLGKVLARTGLRPPQAMVLGLVHASVPRPPRWSNAPRPDASP